METPALIPRPERTLTRHAAVDQVVLTDELGGEALGRTLVNVSRGTLLDQTAVGDDGDAVGNGHRLFLIVGDVDEGDADFLLDALELEAHVLAQIGVERSEWLVEQQDVALQHQRAGELDPLLLPARQLVRHPSVEVAEPDQLQHTVDRVADLLLGQPVELQPEGHVALDVHVGEQGVGLEHHRRRPLVGRQVADVAPMQHHLARGGFREPADQAQQRGLAAPRRAEQDEIGSAVDPEIHRIEGDHRTEGLGEAGDLDGDVACVVHALRAARRSSRHDGFGLGPPLAFQALRPGQGVDQDRADHHDRHQAHCSGHRV